MSGNKSKPSKTGAKKVEVPKEEVKTEQVKEETKKDDFSSKISKYMKKSSNKQKKERDPIIMVSAVVLLICCAIVIGYTIYDKNFADHTEPNVEYGDTVNVEYVGSFYDYYDADGGVIFDTNIKRIGTSSDYRFAHEWTDKDEYESWSVTVGSKGSLAMFEEALIGHHPGETVRVYIPAGMGYELKGGIQTDGKKVGNTIDSVRVFESKDAFETFFGEAPKTTGINTITSPYGWDAQYVVCDDGTVEVTYMVTADDINKVFNEENEVAYKVTGVTSDQITYDLVFEWDGEMLKTFDKTGNVIYITEYYSQDNPEEGRVAGDYDYKIKTGSTSSDDREVSGAPLYFEIKILSYS